MKLLLTSNGISNKSIARALIRLAGKPAKQLKVIFIVTASLRDEGDKGWLIDDFNNVYKLGFSQVDILDFMACSNSEMKRRLRAADIIIVGGGNTLYLSHALKKRGLYALLPKLLKTRVYVGISAGSIVTGPRLMLSGSMILPLYDESKKIVISRNDKGLNFVDFGFRPHLNSPHFKKIRIPILEKRKHLIPFPFYAADDNTAVLVDGKRVEVISEGKWKLFNQDKK